MGYTYLDIEKKAVRLLGYKLPPEDEEKLGCVCAAAAESLSRRLRSGVKREDISEIFTTAAAMTAIAMYVELASAPSGGVSAFTAGKLSVQLGGRSAEAIRQSAESMLGAYIDDGFAFKGVQG